MARRSGLGRGLDALIPTSSEDSNNSDTGRTRVTDDTGDGLRDILITAIDPNPHQPRTTFDDDALDDLARSILELGVLQPILVRPVGKRYELIAGERRWRAAIAAGLESIPALVRTIDTATSAEQALVENLQREDLDPIEEAAAFEHLVAAFALTHEQIAKRVGKSRSAVSNTVRLLGLPTDIQRMVAAGTISAGHGRALLSLDSPNEQTNLANRIAAQGMTVRQVEEAVRTSSGSGASTAGSPSKKPMGAAPKSAAALEVEGQLGDRLDTRVHVTEGAGKGTIVISYADLSDLTRIFNLIV